MGIRSVELSGPRWLVLLLQGVRHSDLNASDTPNLLQQLRSGPGAQLESHPGTDIGQQLFDALPIANLRDRGLELDRRSHCLRTSWQCDRSVVDSLINRPRGRADVIALWFRDVGRAIGRCGLGSAGHRQALRDLDANFLRCNQMLRRNNQAPEVVALMFGAMHEVERTFDLEPALRLSTPTKLFQRTRVRVARSFAKIHCDSMHDAGVCARALVRSPFTNHGSLVMPEELDRLGMPRKPNELVFVPTTRVALGPPGCVASSTFLGQETSDQAFAPWIERPSTNVSVQSIGETLGQRIGENLTATTQPQHDIQHAVGNFPDLLTVMDEDVQRLLGVLPPSQEP